MSNLCDSKSVFYNGSFINESKAAISFDDRGFRYGDGIFDTIRVNKGEMFRFKSHLQRIRRGLEAIGINFDTMEIERICNELLKKNAVEKGFIRIAISRGVGSEGYLPKCGKPTVIIQTLQSANVSDEPVDLWLSSYRKIPDICMPSDIKTAQGLNSTLARMHAIENGCFEALLLGIEGKICEGSSGNIFWFKEGKLYTPANNILKGVMREAVIEKSPYEIVQGDFELDDLKDAEEVFITNIAWVAKPIKSLKPVGFVWERTKVCEEIRGIII
ncbi:MAG: aminotransferase class IV [Rickettsiales bacterium]|nr:aminotransferase class IV [Pseudomonadota bacterium]MDA0965892.1 aminotransferase class IV [Pseudomonadota bacterium]MDG4542638.1 aminotransferase class IV [Rickettsiales bacterium]MDG4545142.1 aminotransferase class IV [Rickettsiales bacterium]MDG4547265.1 aminotransferase class IV [Rickettsiales bacterium]